MAALAGNTRRAYLGHWAALSGWRGQDGYFLVPAEGARRSSPPLPPPPFALSSCPSPRGGVVGPFARPAPRAAGKMPQRSIRGAREQHWSGTVRSMRSLGKTLSVMELAIRPGRPGRDGRSIGGAGATPPKTALACTKGPFGEVAPENFPCRKAGRCSRVPEASPEGIPAGKLRSPGASYE